MKKQNVKYLALEFLLVAVIILGLDVNWKTVISWYLIITIVTHIIAIIIKNAFLGDDK